MFRIDEYVDKLTNKLIDVFGERLEYIGLQGSYLRHEETKNSDIDIMVVIDNISVEDLNTYQKALVSIGNYDKSCGFICGKTDLEHWNPLEIFHLLQTTEDYYGKLNQVYRIPKSVTHIKNLAFARNSFLKEVVLPSGIQVIGAGAFFNDHRLTKINLEQAKKLKRIRDFDGLKEKISLGCWTGVPVGVAVSEESDEEYYAPAEYRKDFYGSGKVRKEYYFLGIFAGTNLKSIQFPEHLKYVAYNTFKNCLHLKKISIGGSYAGEINSDRQCDKKGFSLPGSTEMEIQVSGRNKHYKVKNHILYSKMERRYIWLCDLIVVLHWFWIRMFRKLQGRHFPGTLPKNCVKWWF